MTKSIFVFLVLFGLVGAASWFFVQKNREINQEANIFQVAGLTSPPTTPSTIGANTSQSFKLPSGLEVQDLVIGPGQEVRAGDIIAAHYIGTLADGTKFDSSYDRDQPFVTLLGAGKIIKGWDLGVPGMKIGGKRKLIIPPELGYGTQGSGEVIPPNATLIFEIELLDARSGGQ